MVSYKNALDTGGFAVQLEVNVSHRWEKPLALPEFTFAGTCPSKGNITFDFSRRCREKRTLRLYLLEQPFILGCRA